MSDNSNQTDVSETENDDFSSDYTEYYYRFNISDIKNASKKFYYVINTIIHNYKLIAESENFEINVVNDKTDLSGLAFINQLVKYNTDFQKISEKLISKNNINSKKEYRNNLNLLLRISNETILYISNYYTYKNKKVKKHKLEKLTFQSGSKYQEYNISDIKCKCKFEKKESQKNKKIKFKEVLSEISGISYIIGSDDFDSIIDSILFTPTVIMLYIICSVLYYVYVYKLAEFYCFIIPVEFISISKEVLDIFLLISCISIGIPFVIIWSPIYSDIERRKKSYNQSKDYVINLKDKKKIKWSAVWSLIREIILSRCGSND